MTTITLSTKLPDGNGDGIIDVSAAGAVKYGVPKAGRWWYLPDAPAYSYSDVDPKAVPAPTPTPTPAPEPTPAPPPPADTSLLSVVLNGEAFLQTDAMTVGFNPFGGLGTLRAAPAGFRTDAANGFTRAGLYAPSLDDIVLPGRTIEGFGVAIAGKRYANMQLTGYTQIAGGFKDPLTWEGGVSGVEVTQNIAMAGKTLRIAMTLRNTTSAPIDVQYFRAIDPDQADSFATTNVVTAPGVLESRFKGGKLVTRAEGASFIVQPYNLAQNIGTKPVSGATRDDTVQAVFPRALLAPGQSRTAVVEYEVVV